MPLVSDVLKKIKKMSQEWSFPYLIQAEETGETRKAHRMSRIWEYRPLYDLKKSASLFCRKQQVGQGGIFVAFGKKNTIPKFFCPKTRFFPSCKNRAAERGI